MIILQINFDYAIAIKLKSNSPISRYGKGVNALTLSQAAGINVSTLDQMLLATDHSIRGIRDRALLLVAYDTLCRRSELVSLQVRDIKIHLHNGLQSASILLRKSKTDQDSMGKWLHLSQGAKAALMDWIDQLPVGQESIFCGLS